MKNFRFIYLVVIAALFFGGGFFLSKEMNQTKLVNDPSTIKTSDFNDLVDL